MVLKMIVFLISISLGTYADSIDSIAPEQMAEALKTMPKYLINSFDNQCKSGMESMCLAKKCMNDDMQACKEYMKLPRDLETLKNRDPGQMMKKMFSDASVNELAQYESLTKKCKSKTDARACSEQEAMYHELLTRPLRKNCEQGHESSCSELKGYKQALAELKGSREKRKLERTKRDQENKELANKIQRLFEDENIDQLKTMCFNGEKYACRFIDELELILQNKKTMAESQKKSKKKFEQVANVERALEIIKSVNEDGVTIDELTNTDTQIVVTGMSKNYKSIGNYLQKIKAAQSNEYSALGRDTPWRPVYKQDKSKSPMGFKIEFNKY